ncbi:MAG TPA: TonB-dependent receptor [Bryocella sp.]|nr:TonB-dependent receptor [Bryocella sp.]
MKLMRGVAGILLGFGFVLSVASPRAQSINSSVQGVVTDSTGASVPSAAVTLTNVQTGVVLKGQTDEAGNYAFPSVPLGLYNLSVAKEGFAVYQIDRFNVIVGERATENARLSVASSAQTVTVNAGALADLLQPESNDLGTVITPETVADVPLNGRNFLQLGLLSGATQQVSGAAGSSVGQTGSTGTNGNRLLALLIAGNEPDFTMYLVNGIQTIGTRAGNSSLNLSVSAINQFEVHYGFFMPDLGPNPGIVDVITKSGTNRYHGEVYEYFRNTAMIARDYFAGQPSPYHQNQFGASLGGPIFRDKLFFFFNYEGYRQTQSSVTNVHVPTAAMFTGDFSQSSTIIYNPYNVVGGQRQAFTGNKIPDSMINPAAKALLAYYHPATGGITGNNLSGYPRFTLNSDQYTGRLDYTLNERHSIFAQGSYLNSPENSPGLFPNQGSQYPLDTELIALGWNWTLSSNKVNEFRIGWTRNSVYNQGYTAPGVQASLGISGTADSNGITGVGFTGYAGFGTSAGLLGDVDNSYQVHDAFNWLLGKHQVKFGADIAYTRTVDSSANATARGSLTFQGQFTQQLNCTKSCGGDAFADFLLGAPAHGEAKGMPPTHYRWTTAQPYIQDTWKITPKFTANLALAWYGATSPNPHGVDKNLIHGFDFATGLETFAALGQVNPEVFPMTYTNWAPRIGGSYQIDPHTVIRGGWGMFYTTQMALNVQYSVVSNVITINNAVSNNVNAAPAYILGQNIWGPTAVGQITQAQANAITGPMQYLSETQRSPYIYQYNLDAERTFGPYMLDVAYIGNASHRLAVNFNPFDCSAADFTCDSRRIPYNARYPYMQDVDSIGWGNYNGLVAKFQRQFTNGLSLLANYTYSKSLAAAQEGGNSTLNQMKSCFTCDYGPTTFNVPQSLSVAAVWNVPIGRGRQFGSHMNRALDIAAGGWNLDVIGNFQKGNSINITEPNTTIWPADNTRPNRVCDGHRELANKNPRTNGLRWIVPAKDSSGNPTGCFLPSALGFTTVNGPGYTITRPFGNTHFDALTGPGIDNIDIGIHKDFTIYREWKFGLRGEFFNAFNHTDFANPHNGIGDSQFGQITATQHQPRIIQVAGTINF